jgi:hypothetical protein
LPAPARRGQACPRQLADQFDVLVDGHRAADVELQLVAQVQHLDALLAYVGRVNVADILIKAQPVI